MTPKLAACDELLQELRTVFQRRAVILAPGPARNPARWIEQITDHMETPEVFLLGMQAHHGSHHGITIQHSTSSPLLAANSYASAVIASPNNAATALEHWDPDRSAVVVLGSYLTRPWNKRLFGRTTIGGRLCRWTELEDKSKQPRVWKAAGINSDVRCTLVATQHRSKLLREMHTCDTGNGVVLARDAKSGLTAAGAGTYHMHANDDRIKERLDSIQAQSDKVRVMPYLNGDTCSIHGIALDSGTVVLRPLMQSCAINRETGQFDYFGISAKHLFSDLATKRMIDMARRVGSTIRQSPWGYRGAFSLDIILGEDDSVVATEINSRLSDGFWTMTDDGEVPLALIDLAARSGHAKAIDAMTLEKEILQCWSPRSV